MEKLRSKIAKAANRAELNLIICSMPRNSDGYRSKLFRLLEDTFWAANILSFQSHKATMLKIIDSSKSSSS